MSVHMIIQHNMMAKNVNRQLSISSVNKTQSSERLSSGYRINSAADDAAGLAISEKMRGQIRGLIQASDNIGNSISMVQTADGGLDSVHNILQRMRELHVQGANDINTTSDREEIQREIDQLAMEVDRIGRTTEFNGMKILNGISGTADPLVKLSGNGSLQQQFLTPLANLKATSGAIVNYWGIWMDFENITKKNMKDLIGREFYNTCAADCTQTFKFRFTNEKETTSIIDRSSSKPSLTVNIGLKNQKIKNGADIVKEIIKQGEANKRALVGVSVSSINNTMVGHVNAIAGDGSRLYLYALNYSNLTTPPNFAAGMGMLYAKSLDNSNDMSRDKEKLWVQNGANSGQGIWMEMPVVSASMMRLDKLSVRTHKSASDGLDTIDDSIDYISEERGRLGAYQNRLEHEQANVDVAKENLTGAESRIRDCDVAEEVSALSKQSILEQISQSVLAQANQIPNYTLKLLNQ